RRGETPFREVGPGRTRPCWTFWTSRKVLKLFDRSQPCGECLNDFLAWVSVPADDIEAVSGHAEIEYLHECTCCKRGRHKRIAENADSLSSNYRLDCMQLLAEAEMLHVLEIRQIAPLASGDG